MESGDYTAQALREALGRDDRVGELGIKVTVLGDEVTLTGKVSTAERREVVGTVAKETLPHLSVINNVKVIELEAPQTEEIR